MGRTPVAGVAWQVLHYLEGFKRLGYDVYYIEDTGVWPYDAEKNTVTDDCSYPVKYIGRLMDWCGLSQNWAYRSGVDGSLFGPCEGRVGALFERADVLINVTGATILQEAHLRVPVRIYLETDPVLPQIEVAQGRQFTVDVLNAHTHYFTFGENIGGKDCEVPVGRFKYCPTRQPIVFDWWDRSAEAQVGQNTQLISDGRFTTISNWKQSGKDIEWNGETYRWSKHLQFLRFGDLPSKTLQPLQLALACDDKEVISSLESRGWQIFDAIQLSKDVFPYRDYIKRSRGEFTVAKDQYVRPRSGWFSDRSACFLAAGRPVITQDTGFGDVIPSGEGLFAFSTMDDIVTGIDAINSDYDRHSSAAMELANEFFQAEKVLTKLIDGATSGVGQADETEPIASSLTLSA